MKMKPLLFMAALALILAAQPAWAGVPGYPRAGWQAELDGLFHDVAGTVTIVNATTLPWVIHLLGLHRLLPQCPPRPLHRRRPPLPQSRPNRQPHRPERTIRERKRLHRQIPISLLHPDFVPKWWNMVDTLF